MQSKTESSRPKLMPGEMPPIPENQHAAVPPMWLSRGHIPSLDGLRACSIWLVLVAHFSQQGRLLPNHWILTDLGHLGVDMFFVISGFIITTLLLREYDRHQGISIVHFYLRRAFRILPAYFCFLLGIAFLCYLGQITLRSNDWLGALTYSVSFMCRPNWDIGHIWTLSVEEHFYVLWPFVVWLWPRRAWIVALFTVLTAPLLRLQLPHILPGVDYHYCTLTRLDTIAVGCGLAYLAQTRLLWHVAKWPSWLAYATTTLLALCVGASHIYAIRKPWYDLYLAQPIIALSYAGAIWIWCVHHRTWLGRILNWKPMVWIGVLSYSLYLWQQPFLSRDSEGMYTQPPLSLIGFVVMAHVSYLLVEKPMLRLKDRLYHAT